MDKFLLWSTHDFYHHYLDLDLDMFDLWDETPLCSLNPQTHNVKHAMITPN